MLAGAVAGTALGPHVLDLAETDPILTHAEIMDQLTQLCHDIFVNRINQIVALGSPLSAVEGQHRFKGSAMVFYTDLKWTQS